MNLLTDPLLRANTEKGLTHLSLPGLMASLGQDEVYHLPGVQRHQEDALHVFLCQLAGTVLARRGDSEPGQDEEYWRKGLRSLAGDAGDDAWTLVVGDLSRPAFMQPPLPEADHARLRTLALTPDELDLLVTPKNHDVKRARASHSQADHWVYTLINLQTMSGYSGRGNPGISRMNSGFGNRPIVELVGSRSLGGRWRDAVVRLLDHRVEVLEGEYGYDDGGLVLVWLEMWDGSTSLALSQLDPFYIEVCRRIRLRGDQTVTHAETVGCSSERIAAKELRGVVGDPWLPVDTSGTREEKALTASPRGLTPEILRRLIFSDALRLTTLQQPLGEWKDRVWLQVSVLVRGQGKTDGFHESRVFLPSRARRVIFGPPAPRDRLAELSKDGIGYAGKMSRVLKRALFTYLQGGPERLQFDRDSAAAYWEDAARHFQSSWSQSYFPWLWSVPKDFDRRAVLRKWAVKLRDYAMTVLREAQRSMPSSTGRSYRSRIKAERAFWGALYHKNNFPFLKEEKTHEHATDI